MKVQQQPKFDRPVMPDGYGVPETSEGLLAWDYVEEQMGPSLNYWITTASKQGRPAATPVWGVWMDGKLYFDGSPTTRRGRNIAENPEVVVHLESGSQVVILEGQAVILNSAPDRSISERLAAGYSAKYSQFGYSPTPDQWDQGGLYIFTPRKVIAWTKFPETVTRWQFE